MTALQNPGRKKRINFQSACGCDFTINVLEKMKTTWRMKIFVKLFMPRFYDTAYLLLGAIAVVSLYVKQ